MKYTIMLFVLILNITGCKESPDFDKMRSEILDLHNNVIDAHLNKDVDFFVKDIADDYFSVGNGEIRNPAKEEISARFKNYLNSTTFTEYKNLQEPVIGFSEDGSVGWSIVQVNVAGKRTMDGGIDRDFDNTFAWITLYQRQDDKWIRLGEVSNYK
jgi:hypothetical protein